MLSGIQVPFLYMLSLEIFCILATKVSRKMISCPQGVNSKKTMYAWEAILLQLPDHTEMIKKRFTEVTIKKQVQIS